MSELSVTVNGKTYSVDERPGYLKANLNGIFGWDSVWADNYVQLVRRIKRVLAGDQQ
jgi:hypothetical protein